MLAKVLPPKQEYVLKIRLSDVQDKLYRSFLEEKRGRYCASDLFSTYAALAKVYSYGSLLSYHTPPHLIPSHHTHVTMFSHMFLLVPQVWNHPWVLKMDEHRKSERELAMSGEDEDASLEGFIVYGSEDESVSSKSTVSAKYHTSLIIYIHCLVSRTEPERECVCGLGSPVSLLVSHSHIQR